MRRLHTRIYLALLISQMVVVAIIFVLWHLDGGGPIRNRMSTLIAIPWIAIGVSIVAYPISRRLTKRLERLQNAVELLGAGNLSSRVAVEGNDEIAHLATSFNSAAERIEELVHAHKSLLANASHELRTPLTRIRLSTELIKEIADPQRKAGLQQDIAELDLLIDEILLASRLDAIVESTAGEEIDLLGLAAEECARYDNVQLTGSSLLVRGEAKLLRRLLRNLLENAQSHGVPPIDVTISRTDSGAEIAVCDNGAAIPAEERDRLFEPFYRRAETNKNIGAGLGLALVRQIAKRHGGSVQYRATVSGHNGFFVTLPT